MSSILVAGSVALDTVETPHGTRKAILGGSATLFALSACRFAPVRLVSIVGKDFPAVHVEAFHRAKIDTEGLEFAAGKTFRWHGRYTPDMNDRVTVGVELNVLADYQPRVPESYRKTPYVFLANGTPAAQAAVLDRMIRPDFVCLDTMDLWIRTARTDLVRLLARVDALIINNQEAALLTGTLNLITAAKSILRMGPKAVLIKKAEHGGFLACGREIFSLPAYPTEEVVDPTGAGDAFAGGIMGHIARTGDTGAKALKQALLYGTVMGSFAVEDFGVEKLVRVKPAEIEKRVRLLRRMITL